MMALGLVASVATADDPPTKGGKATLQVVGQFTADKDTTFNYTLKKGTKVIAEEKGLTALPGKGVEVDAADVMGPFDLTVSATGGVLKVSKIGAAAKADGKNWEGIFGGKIYDLNAKDASGAIVRAVTFPVTLSLVKPEEPKKKPDDTKKPDETKKKPDGKKPDEKKKIGDTERPDDSKKTDAKKLPVAPSPNEK
jgi:hypothetical protein